MLFMDKKEQTPDTCNSMEKSQKHMQRERSHTEKAIYCMICWHSRKDKTIKEIRSAVSRDWEW